MRHSFASGSAARPTDFLLVDPPALSCAVRTADASAVLAPIAERTLRILRPVEMRSDRVPRSAQRLTDAVVLDAPRSAQVPEKNHKDGDGE